MAIWNMNDLVEARWVEGSTLFIRFDDGTAGQVDLSGYRGRGSIFEPLRDLDVFKRFAIEGGTLAWPNGADIAPERLYAMAARDMVTGPQAPATSGQQAIPHVAVQKTGVDEAMDD